MDQGEIKIVGFELKEGDQTWYSRWLRSWNVLNHKVTHLTSYRNGAHSGREELVEDIIAVIYINIRWHSI